MRLNSLLLTIFLSLLCTLPMMNAFGTMSVDLGNEFMKSGIPMEIALNKESKRKTASLVSFKNNERTFGSSAESIAIKYPANAYQYIPSLIGKTLEHVSVKKFQERFPFYHLEFDLESSQLVFKQDGKIVFTVEELMAMLLYYAKEIAESYAGERINSAVIIVPSHFGQAERRAMMRAANIANLNVHHLMNENTAVALHFGVSRTNSFNVTAQHYMFFNMGSQTTSASIVRYEMIKDKSSGIAVDIPQLTIIGVGSDPHLGITELVIALRTRLANEFKKQYKLDIFKDNRAMMKLLKEAKRVVTVLSANQETFAQVEYLMDEKDFKMKVTREELESLFGDIESKIKAIFDETLETAQIPVDEIREIVLMGGGTRVPKVQEILQLVSGKKELARSINSDEAAAMGAVYQAAFLSPGFRVKRFNVKDFNYYPLKVFYKSPIISEDTGESELKDKDVLLYARGNAFPQKRGLSINKQSSDMEVYVDYSGLEKSFIKYLLPSTKFSANLTKIHLKNVSQTIKPSLEEGAIMKGFKLHFDMDDSGIFSLTSIDARLERNIPEMNNTTNKTTLESIRDTIGDFFSGGTTDNGTVEETLKKQEEEKSNLKENVNNNFTENATTTQKPEPLPKLISIPITFLLEYLDAPTPSEEILMKSKSKLKDLHEYEQKLITLEKSRNELESSIYNTRDRLDQKSFIEFSSESEKKEISGALDLASQWYDEQGEDTTFEDYEKQLNIIKEVIKPVDSRIKEYKERPEALKNSLKMLDVANEIHEVMDKLIREPNIMNFFSNLTKDFGIFPFDRYMEDLDTIVRDTVSKAFTQDQIINLKRLISEHETWHNDTDALLSKVPKHEDASVKISDIIDKSGNLVREITSYREKYDNNRRTLFIERWIKNKKKELKSEEDAAKKNETSSEININNSEQKNESSVRKESESEKKEESHGSSTPRSDL